MARCKEPGRSDDAAYALVREESVRRSGLNDPFSALGQQPRLWLGPTERHIVALRGARTRSAADGRPPPPQRGHVIRIGDFDLDPTAPLAHAHLLRTAWCPRGTRERLALHALLVADRLSLLLLPRALGRPSPAPADAPAHEDTLAAATAALADAQVRGMVESGLSRVPVGSGRLVYLWGEGLAAAPATTDADDAPSLLPPSAVAISSRDDGSSTAHVESMASVRALPWEIAAPLPSVIAVGRDGLPVVVESLAPGVPLLRLHRLASMAGRWDPETFAQVGRWLGRLHSATAQPDQREELRCRAHGGLSSERVFFRPARARSAGGRLACVTTWRDSTPDGDAAADIARFLVASADEDLAGRGAAAEAVRRSPDELARWLFLPGSPPFAAGVECLAAWREMIGPMARRLDLKDLLVDRVCTEIARGRDGTLAQETREALVTFLAGPGPLAGRRDRRRPAHPSADASAP